MHPKFTGALRNLCFALAVGLFFVAGAPWVPAHTAPATIKLAFFNIKSGRGQVALPGFPSTFANTGNCTDHTQPLNAWGVGIVQAELMAKVGNDPNVISLGLNEAWPCATPSAVRAALGWKAHSSERNGVAIVARHGFAGPEQWTSLDISLNINPKDTMWVLRIPVCVDAACSSSIVVFTTHWLGDALTEEATALTYNTQAQQTVDFMNLVANAHPQVLLGDLNVSSGTQTICGHIPRDRPLQILAEAGYLDAWTSLHGGADGSTGMWNRAGCGTPVGNLFKRIDYSWSRGMSPVSMTRFGMVVPGHESPSDHAGIIVEYPTSTTTVLTAPTPSRREIVLRASDAAQIVGNWVPTPDSTAAGGVRLQNPNLGAAKLLVPSATPTSHFELTFEADAGVPYRLWLRGKAQNDDYANDSVFVQFDRSVDAWGVPIARIGSAAAETVVIEDCGGCGLSGWGWQDNAYGAGVAPALIYFAESGPQRMRVQVREDGIGLDQLVLSAGVYLSVPPGAVKDDRTILPLTTAPAPAPAPPPVSGVIDEIVLYAADAVPTGTAWTRTQDVTAAGGARLQNWNMWMAKLTQPLAAPASYFELTFEAEAGKAYRLWLRGKAEDNDFLNDSVFIQFDRSVDAAGAAVSRIGSVVAEVVVLEDCGGCGLSGWGWQDNGYGAGALGPAIRFAQSGTQRMRVQVREDGIAIDQITLSAVRYATMPPGALKNDATILGR